MSGPRPTRLALAVLCGAMLAVRPAPAVAQISYDRTYEQSDHSCGLQRGATHRDPACVPPPEAPPERVRDNGGPSGLGILGAIIAVVVSVLVAKALTGDKDRSVKDIAEDGPTAPEKELLGQYEVQGLIYPSWPLVVEVADDPDATTFVRIVPAKGDKDAIPPLIVSEAGGTPWGAGEVIRPVEVQATERGTLARFLLPADLGRRGDDGFHSARLSVLSGRVEGDRFNYRPVDVLALGAGPTAVGSAALQITQFEPVAERRRAEFTVSWNARRRFENVDAELVQRTSTARAVTRKVLSTQDICLTPEERDLCVSGPSSALPYPRRGQWPAEEGRELEPGQSYHMQLRAWTGRHSGGGWIVGQAPRTIGW